MNNENDRLVDFNVGGLVFTIKYSTLCSKKKLNEENSLLLAAEKSDAIFFDRDNKYFSYILNYFRYKEDEFSLPHSSELKYILNEAKYFKINHLCQIIKFRMHNISKILCDGYIQSILLNCSSIKTASMKLKLIYKASINGYSAKDFHFNCDNISNTLTIIESKNGTIFGGFTQAKWSSCGKGALHGFQKDDSSFLFKIRKNSLHDFIEIIRIQSNRGAIYNHANNGPCFGEGHEIYISDHSNSNYKSYSHLGLSYKHNGFGYKTIQSRTFLAETFEFKVNEIEVIKIE